MKNNLGKILKLTTVLAPALVFGISAAGLGTAHAVYIKEKERVYKLYRETDEDFSSAQRMQLDNLEEDFKAGQITEEEYNEKKEYLSSDKFTESVIELDTTLDDEVKSLKNKKDQFFLAAYSSFTMGLIAGGLSCAIYPERIKEMLVKAEMHKNATKNKNTQLPKPLVYNMDEESKPESKSERKTLADYHEEVEEQPKK